MKAFLNTSLFAASLLGGLAHAEVSVSEAWVRATVPQQKATGAFMQLRATEDSKLVAASSPLTPTVQIHEMVMQDNIMRMREIPALNLPARKTVDLGPGGYHVMLMNLSQQVKEGEVVPLTLVVEGKDGKRESIQVQAPVRALNASAQPSAHDAHKH